MKRFIGLSGLALFTASCTLYFGGTPSSDEPAVALASMSDGTTLSRTNANDIDPFVYYAADGNSYLFFASDRGNTEGDYDIYYARRVGTKFDGLAKIDMGIEVSATSPVVFNIEDSMNGGAFICLVFIGVTVQDSLGVITSTTDVYDCLLGLNNTVFDTSSEASSLGIGNASDLSYDPYTGNMDVLITNWLGLYGIEYYGSVYVSPQPGSSISGTGIGKDLYLFYSADEAGGLEYPTFIYSETVEGKRQIDKAFRVVGSVTNFYDLTAYVGGSQEYNDCAPFVDMNDVSKVYFASDRSGHGKYDLWRYNVKTFTKTVFGYDSGFDSTAVYVSAANGSDENSGLLSARPARNLGLAVNFAEMKNIKNVYVDNSGKYTADKLFSINHLYGVTTNYGVKLNSDNMTLVGGFNPGFVSMGARSVIDMGYVTNGVCISLYNVTNVSLRNFEVTNILFDNFNAIYMSMANRCFVSNFIVRGGVQSYGGGMGLYMESSMSNRILSCTFRNLSVTNISYYGGAGMLLYNSSFNNIQADIVSCLSPSMGGGLAMYYSFHNTVVGKFTSDTAATNGGGIYMNNSLYNALSVKVEYCRATNGGGMYLDTGSYSNTFNGVVQGNTALSIGGIYFYSGIHDSTFLSDLVITNNTVWNTN